MIYMLNDCEHGHRHFEYLIKYTSTNKNLLFTGISYIICELVIVCLQANTFMVILQQNIVSDGIYLIFTILIIFLLNCSA